jgi:hypothetical protein
MSDDGTKELEWETWQRDYSYAHSKNALYDISPYASATSDPNKFMAVVKIPGHTIEELEQLCGRVQAVLDGSPQPAEILTSPKSRFYSNGVVSTPQPAPASNAILNEPEIDWMMEFVRLQGRVMTFVSDVTGWSANEVPLVANHVAPQPLGTLLTAQKLDELIEAMLSEDNLTGYEFSANIDADYRIGAEKLRDAILSHYALEGTENG